MAFHIGGTACKNADANRQNIYTSHDDNLLQPGKKLVVGVFDTLFLLIQRRSVKSETSAKILRIHYHTEMLVVFKRFFSLRIQRN